MVEESKELGNGLGHDTPSEIPTQSCAGQRGGQEGVAPNGAAILWVDNAATRIFWINDQGLSGEGSQSIGHWLNGEDTLHSERNGAPYLARIVALLERIERYLLIGHHRMGGSDGQGADGNPLGIREWELRRLPDQPAQGDGLERLTRLLERDRPDLQRRVVAILALETERLDDALLFALARRYLHPLPARERP
jgi:hypothetical protein